MEVGEDDEDLLIVVNDSSMMDEEMEQDKFYSSMMDDDVGVKAILTVDYHPLSAIQMIELIRSRISVVLMLMVAAVVVSLALVEELEGVPEVD